MIMGRNMTRWAEFKSLLKDKNFSKLKAFKFLINGFPQIWYPAGELAYNEECERCKIDYGNSDSLRCFRIVIWRELFHFIGGLFLGILTFIFAYRYIWPCAVFIIFIRKEINEDMKDQPDGFRIKNFLDALCWGLGALTFEFFWKLF